MQDLQRPQITKSGRIKDGYGLRPVPRDELPSALQNEMGERYERLLVISDEVRWRKRHFYLLTRCVTCGEEGWRAWKNLKRGTAGCRKCGRRDALGREALIVPRWLYRRAQAAEQRCINPNDANYARYGARGIEFRFASARAMARWIQDNLGLERQKEIDRIDNDGHYEAGNLRWASRAQNVANSRKSKVTLMFHRFRLEHPEIRYADATLRRLFLEGLTTEQIIERYHRPSCKPKGVYGTFSMPDLDIVSQ